MQQSGRVEYINEIVTSCSSLKHGQRAYDNDQIPVFGVLDPEYLRFERVVRANDYFLQRQIEYLPSDRVEFSKARRAMIWQAVARVKRKPLVESSRYYTQQLEIIYIYNDRALGMRVSVVRIRVIELIIGRDEQNSSIRANQACIRPAIESSV